MILPIDPQPLVVETGGGERSFTHRDRRRARTSAQRGLMFRQDMDDDHGMLFVFDEQRQVGFWMKNTPMPLDLVFIGQDGDDQGGQAGRAAVRSDHLARQPVRFVLELKAGIAAGNDIERGDRVRHRAINQAPAGHAGPGIEPREGTCSSSRMTASTSPFSTGRRTQAPASRCC